MTTGNSAVNTRWPIDAKILPMVVSPAMNLSDYLRGAFPTQAKAAQAFGVTQSTINHWITGRRRPDPSNAAKIVRKSRGKVSFACIYGPS